MLRHSRGPPYRKDIDGLRALAVLSVVLMHARLVPTSGGIAGVDIFFVISGFLITSILRAEFLQNDWSITRFYIRRARRLLPALVVVLIAANLIALWGYSAEQEREILIDSLTALGFSSNFHFVADVNFFAPLGYRALLLHTWSLAVEEQYYIVFPFFLLALLARGGDRRATGMFVVTIALSFCLAVWTVESNPSFAYSMLPTRAWQLLLGALIALPTIPVWGPAAARWASAAGLMMILATPFAFNAEAGFPGFASLVPCVGTALVIHAGRGRPDIPVARLLGTSPLTFFGRISYSLYLWHVPLLLLAVLLSGGALSVFERAAVVVITVAISALSWRFIEVPFRRPAAAATETEAAPPTASRA